MALVLSYSFASDMINCPRKAWHKFVARDLPKEMTDAMERGIVVHEAFAARPRVREETRSLPAHRHAHWLLDVNTAHSQPRAK